MSLMLKDRQWIRRSFLLSSEGSIDQAVADRDFSHVSLKFTDTTPGGNRCINPPPQFTEHADIVKPSLVYNSSKGMGRAYGEMIDDNSQVIHIRAGVTAFNSMTTFFTGFYNTDMGRAARTGRGTSLLYLLGKVVGFVVTLTSWPLLTLHAINFGSRISFSKPATKYCYLKPAMPLYWNAVTTMVNHIAVNTGIITRIFSKEYEQLAGAYQNDNGQSFNNPTSGGEVSSNTTEGNSSDKRFHKALYDKLPGIFLESGGVNVYEIATRAARLEIEYTKKMQEILDKENAILGKKDISLIRKSSTEVISDFLKSKSFRLTNSSSAFVTPDSTGSINPLSAYVESWLNTELGKPDPNAKSYPVDGQTPTTTATPSSQPSTGTSFGVAANSTTSTTPNTTTSQPTASSDGNGEIEVDPRAANGGEPPRTFWNFITSEWEDGAAFASFRVDYTGSVSESFSNSTRESDIQNKFNDMVSSARAIRFNLADGGVIPGAAEVIGGATALLSGLVDGMGLSGLVALAGNAFVDIPEHWESSVANMSSSSYSMTLISWSGDPLSQLINIYIPLCMILGFALPISTGTASYSAPFMLEWYDKGRSQSRYGILESLNITRGVSNLGFTRDGKALALDITFTLKDLSSIITMPISEGFSLNPATALFDPDSLFNDYMAVLSGMGVADQMYTWKKMKLNFTRQMAHWDTYFSKAHMASFLGNAIPGARVISGLFRGVAPN